MAKQPVTAAILFADVQTFVKECHFMWPMGNTWKKLAIDVKFNLIDQSEFDALLRKSSAALKTDSDDTGSDERDEEEKNSDSELLSAIINEIDPENKVKFDGETGEEADKDGMKDRAVSGMILGRGILSAYLEVMKKNS